MGVRSTSWPSRCITREPTRMIATDRWPQHGGGAEARDQFHTPTTGPARRWPNRASSGIATVGPDFAVIIAPLRPAKLDRGVQLVAHLLQIAPNGPEIGLEFGRERFIRGQSTGPQGLVDHHHPPQRRPRGVIPHHPSKTPLDRRQPRGRFSSDPRGDTFNTGQRVVGPGDGLSRVGRPVSRKGRLKSSR
jgi:hypothetical protein